MKVPESPIEYMASQVFGIELVEGEGGESDRKVRARQERPFSPIVKTWYAAHASDPVLDHGDENLLGS